MTNSTAISLEPPKMIATNEEMEEAKIPVSYRDYCAHHFIKWHKCLRLNFFHHKCHEEELEWEKCEYQETMNKDLLNLKSAQVRSNGSIPRVSPAAIRPAVWTKSMNRPPPSNYENQQIKTKSLESVQDTDSGRDSPKPRPKGSKSFEKQKNSSRRSSLQPSLPTVTEVSQLPAAKMNFVERKRAYLIGQKMRNSSLSSSQYQHSDSQKEQQSISGRSKPLKGSIMLQMVVHYLIFIVILVSASQTFAKNIRNFGIVFYVFASFVVLEISRLIYAMDEYSFAPLYLSIVPSFILFIVSREAHTTVMPFWYVSLLIVFLQSGNLKLRIHVVVYSVIFMGFYALAVYLISIFYVCRQNDFCLLTGVPLNPGIDWLKEMILILSCFILVFSVVMLERFVKKNATLLTDRENYVNALLLANFELRREIRKFNREKETDLVSPIVRVMKTLQEIRNSPQTDTETRESIENAIKILSSNQLFIPTLQANMDTDVEDWLTNVLGSYNNDQSFKQISLPRASSKAKQAAQLEIQNQQTEALEKCFESLNSPRFNVFELSTLTANRPLFSVCVRVLEDYDLISYFKFDRKKLFNWLTKIEQSYHAVNPYHNALHAADVVYMFYYFINMKKLSDEMKLSNEEMLACFLAAAIHDVGHPGVNNAFYINISHPIALLYNDNAVLEHYHLSYAFELLFQEENNFFSSLTNETKKMVRDLMIQLVLSTDMAAHFEWVGKFKNKLLTEQGFNLQLPADRKLILCIAMKASDINNATKPLPLCLQWTDLITEEFFRQGDQEKQRGMPVSAFMNRESTDIPKMQIGFIDFLLTPLYEPWINYLGKDAKEIQDSIQFNRQYWKTKTEPQQQQQQQQNSVHQLPNVTLATTSTPSIAAEK